MLDLSKYPYTEEFKDGLTIFSFREIAIVQVCTTPPFRVATLTNLKDWYQIGYIPAEEGLGIEEGARYFNDIAFDEYGTPATFMQMSELASALQLVMPTSVITKRLVDLTLKTGIMLLREKYIRNRKAA